MKILKTTIGTDFGGSLLLWIDWEIENVSPVETNSGPNSIIPFAAVLDRKARENISPCADCVNNKRVSCTCLVCACCKEALDWLLAEQHVVNHPDLTLIDSAKLERLSTLGAVPAAAQTG